METTRRGLASAPLQVGLEPRQLLLGDGLAVLPGLGEPLLGPVARHHGGGQRDLLVGVQQGHLADLLQVHADGVVDVEAVHQGVGVDQLLLLDLGDLLQGGLHVLRQVAGELVAGQLDVQGLQGVVDLLHLGVVQVQLVHDVAQLGGVDLALLLGADEEILQLLVALQKSGGGQRGDGLVVQLGALGLLFPGLRALVVLGQELIGHLLQLLIGHFLTHVAFLRIPFFLCIYLARRPAGPLRSRGRVFPFPAGSPPRSPAAPERRWRRIPASG